MVKKRGRKIQFNFSNRFLYTLIAAVVIISLGVIVYALAPGQTPNPGHNISQLGAPSTCSPNQVLQWNGNAWQCADLPGASSGGPFERGPIMLYLSAGTCDGGSASSCTLTGPGLLTNAPTTSLSGNCPYSCTLINIPIGYTMMPTPKRFMAGYDFDNNYGNPPGCWTFDYFESITEQDFGNINCLKVWNSLGGSFTGGANACTNSWTELIESNNNPLGAALAGSYTFVSATKVGTITNGCRTSANPASDLTSYTYIVEYIDTNNSRFYHNLVNM